MKKLWKCSVCGYIHEGEDAPESAPNVMLRRTNLSSLAMKMPTRCTCLTEQTIFIWRLSTLQQG